MVTSSHVEAHAVGPTLDVLLQALVYILTSLSVCHESVSSGTETPVAARCVDALMLTRVPHLTLVNVDTRASHSLGPVAPRAGAVVAASGVLTDLVVSALMSTVSALINVYTCAIAPFGHTTRAQVYAGVTASSVFTLLVRPTNSLPAFIYVYAASASQLVSRLTRTAVATNSVQTVLVAWIGVLTLINI